MNPSNNTKLLVKKILENSHAIDGWTIQGLGMLRLYLSPTKRLHIWHKAIQYRDATKLHDHAWDLHSKIVVGKIRNKIYKLGGLRKVYKHLLIPGEGGGLLDEKEIITLKEPEVSEYIEGGSYYQGAEEIHETEFVNGTVTIVDRFPRSDKNPDRANVFYDVGTEWGSAEPRPASQREIQIVVDDAMALINRTTM